MRVSKLYTFIIYIVAFTLVTANVTTYFFTKAQKGRTKMIRISGLLGVVAYALFSSTAFLSRVTKAGLLIKICQGFTNIHLKLNQIGHQTNLNAVKKINWYIIVFISTIATFNTVFQLIFYTRAHFWVGIAALVVRAIMAFSINYALCMLNVVNYLWRNLDEVLSTPFSPIQHVKKSYGRILTVLASVQEELYLVSNLIGEFFGPIFLTAFGSMTVAIIIHLYCIYYYIAAILRKDPDIWLFERLTTSVTMTVFHICLMIGIAATCQKLTDISKEVQRKMVKVNVLYQEIYSTKVKKCDKGF